MAEKWLATYSTVGNNTFTASGGTYRFHVIGSGGNGATGGFGSRFASVWNGGNGGAGGGYAIHQLALLPGETASIVISEAKTTLVCKGNTVEATAGKQYTTVGQATGGNISNKPGNAGTAGSPGSSSSNSNGIGGQGGMGGGSAGKYQASGGSGGSGGSFWSVASGGLSGSRAADGVSATNTVSAIGGTGGGGGGGSGGGGVSVSGSTSGYNNGGGGKGAIGGVVIEVVNSAPTAPAYIDISEEKILAGKSANLLWGAAEDVDGNLAGYILERSADSGAWTQVYKGSLRQYTDTISMNWNTVQYRVKAYDTQESESGYVATVAKTIIHNTPPSAPPSFYLPQAVYGGSTITVSWGQSTDADNNLTGYTLERCVDGGAWAEIANITGITANAEITFGWQTVQFRVRAYDSYGAVGDYVVSQIANIINNRAPVVSGEDRDLGTIIDAFVPQKYTVTDEDGNVVTVVEKLDGTVKRTFDAVLGAENTLEIAPDAWRKLLNGVHTWSVTATDALGACTIRTLTFTKTVSEIRFALTNPLPADAMPERFIMSIQGAVPDDATLTIEACNNGFDKAPAWEDITTKVLRGQKYFFQNKDKVAEKWGIGVRVSMERGSATGDCYIHSHRGNYA